MPNLNRQAIVKFANRLSSSETEEWEHLCRSHSSLASPFLSPHFARAISESGMDARVCIIRDNGEIAAFFPFLFEGRWAKILRIAQRVGGELTDTFGVIAESNFRTSTDELLRLAGINYLNFSHLDEVQLQFGLTGEQPRLGLRALLNPMAEPVLTSVNSVTKHYLKDSAKRLRKLTEEIGPLNFQFDVEDDRGGMLELLIQQKRAQYRASGVPDSLKESWKRQTLAQLLDYKFDSCRGVLSSLYAGNAWIASHYGVMGNGIFHLWFPVYNPEFAKYSPGRMLLHHIVESCKEYRFDTIDRGEGDTPRKREIANQEYRLYRGVWKKGAGIASVVHNFNRFRWRVGI